MGRHGTRNHIDSDIKIAVQEQRIPALKGSRDLPSCAAFYLR